MENNKLRRQPRMSRLIIYPKDIMILTGKSDQTSRKIYNKIKKTLNKQRHQPLSIYEYCQHEGLLIDDVIQLLI